MNNKKIILVLAAVGLATLSGYGLYALGMRQGMKATTPMSDSAAAVPKSAGADKNVLYWHDPMVPGQKFDKPGNPPSWTCNWCQCTPTATEMKARSASVRAYSKISAYAQLKLARAA